MSIDGIVCQDDYMDADVAYLLGMCFGRGQLLENGDIRKLIITLSIRRSLPKLPPTLAEAHRSSLESLNLDIENERCLNRAQGRISELLDASVKVDFIKKGEAVLSAVFPRKTIGWRNLKTLTCGGTDHGDFLLPGVFLGFPQEIHKEFLRGFADVAVTPSFSDNAWGRRCRVAFPVVYRNRKFAKQLVKVFEGIGIDAPLLLGSAAKRGGVKREHRIRPYADDYEAVGFHFTHKNRLVRAMADFNRRLAEGEDDE